MKNPTPTEMLDQINVLCKDQVRRLYESMEKLGAEVKDESGRIIPQPQTDRERIMFAAGQVSLALFIQGATMALPTEKEEPK